MLRAMVAAVLHLGMVGAAHAQMPVPLLDNEPAAPNAALWAVAGPMLQAALECREDLPDHPATRALLPRKPADESAGGVPQHMSGRSAAACRAASNSEGRRQHVRISAP